MGDDRLEDTMHKMTLRGTPAQMGQQHGSLIGKLNIQLPPTSPEMQVLANDCEQLCLQHTPELVEEMQAFAAAANLPYDSFKQMMLTIALQQNIPSCSVVAVMPERTADGKLMVGRNYDFVYNIAWDTATTYTTYPANGHKHMGSCDIWIGREDGMNDAGLFAAMSATFVPGIAPGIPFWFIVRHILEHFTSVDEAVEWIQTIPHSQSRNYMLADANKAVVVEATVNGCYIREPEDGILVMTNHPAHPTLAAQKPFKPDDSPIRYDRLRAFPDANITLNDMQTALNDRENHVCAHSAVYGDAFGTIWSAIAYPADKRLDIAQGTGHDEGTMTYQSYTI